MNTRHHAPNTDPEKESEFEIMLTNVPGARFIKDQWRNDPLILGKLTIEDGWKNLAWPQQATLRCFDHWDLDEHGGQVLVLAPLLAIELMAWHTAEYVSYYEDVHYPAELRVYEPKLVAGAMATLMACGDADAENVDQKLLEYLETASRSGVETSTYLAALASLAAQDNVARVALAVCVTPIAG
jgi:hypothetical protein